MGKPTKRKKEKVPKISEAEYVAYVSSLRGTEPRQEPHTGNSNIERTKKIER